MNRAQKIERLVTAIGLTLVGVMGLIGAIGTWNLREGEYRSAFLLLTALSLGLGGFGWRQYFNNLPLARGSSGRWIPLITAVMDFALIAGWGYVWLRKWPYRSGWDNYAYLTLTVMMVTSWGTQGILNIYRFFRHEELQQEDEKDG